VSVAAFLVLRAGTAAWGVWAFFHRTWIGVTLALALVLTIYSMLDYLWRYRSLAGFRS